MTENKFENSPKTGEEINRVFKIQKNQGWQRGTSALAAEICAGPHNRLLRRQHCSSLCSQSEGHEHVANMASALGHIFVGFLAVFGRHNIRPPHFASKVSYSASPHTFAECSRSASCCYAAIAMKAVHQSDTRGVCITPKPAERPMSLPFANHQPGRLFHCLPC